MLFFYLIFQIVWYRLVMVTWKYWPIFLLHIGCNNSLNEHWCWTTYISVVLFLYFVMFFLLITNSLLGREHILHKLVAAYFTIVRMTYLGYLSESLHLITGKTVNHRFFWQTSLSCLCLPSKVEEWEVRLRSCVWGSLCGETIPYYRREGLWTKGLF